MKMAFVVYNDFYTDSVMQMLQANGIDYYTSWERATGKGRGTEPHLGRGSFPSTNTVLMIAFQEEAPLNNLIQAIKDYNAKIDRPSDRTRLFVVPLECIV